jgi:uncharacterized protein YktB (UPF0637 family)
MNSEEKFINWLEGFLDGTKNQLNASQIKEIRKRISEFNKNKESTITKLFEKNEKDPSQNSEFIDEVKRLSNSGTLEELGK